MGGLVIRNRSAPIVALALLLPLAAALPAPTPPFVPEVTQGFAIAPLAAVPVATSLTFGPGGEDGPDAYVTSLLGTVYRIPLTWTPAGPVAGPLERVASGFSSPLGLVFEGDVLYVADSAQGQESGRLDGRVWRLEDDERRVVVGGLPNGRHNTNNLRFGPDGLLYIANGNPNDDGVSGGDPDVLPYSGAILRVDTAVVTASSAILRWKDESGNTIAPDDIASHPRNADFAAKVDVFASGFRNVYDVAFSPSGAAYTGTNGADATPSQDLFYKLSAGADYGFPFCYNVGTPGGTDVTVVAQENYPDADCSNAPPAQAMLGWHVCATGLDVAPPGTFIDSVFVGECGPFFVDDLVRQSLVHPAHAMHNTGHKVVRVPLDANGDAGPVRDFITGLHLPVDVVFGPDGAMYVADIDTVYRVVELA